MKGEINSKTIIVEDFNIPLTAMDRLTKQKISKETQTLNSTMVPLDLIYIYRAFHTKMTDFTFHSSRHRTFFKIYHIQGHKSSLDKFFKMEIISSIFSVHNAVRLDVSYRKTTTTTTTIKHTNIWRLNNTLLSNQQIKKEIKKESLICIEANENENTTTQNL